MQLENTKISRALFHATHVRLVKRVKSILLNAILAQLEKTVEVELQVVRIVPQEKLKMQVLKNVPNVAQESTAVMQMRILPAKIAQQEDPVQRDQLRVHRVVLVRSLLLRIKHALSAAKESIVVVWMKKIRV